MHFRDRAGGFSLVELIVVMLVISILAVWGIEKITTVLSSTRAQLAANELCVNLRYIRNMAMDRERTTRVIFSVASNSYSVAISDTNGIFSQAANPVTQSPWEVYVDERFPGVELVGVSNIPNNTLDFSATNGIPLNTNGVWLTTTGSITFNSSLTVTIMPDTGYIGLSP
ncbi:MAG: prepilin-type N-terminal cleavage/methylation domain-containing protein [Kiritimatiellae bacterium]|nr:prepilin-type N-terminal cleavage/methylation domain-containing protein [Kiritimatiellia bacterium]